MLHNLAANVILKLETGNDNALIALMSSPMAANTKISDPFKLFQIDVLPFLILLMFVPPVYNTVFMLVKEKESRVKEAMRMMGMKDTSYWLSWYVYYTVITTVICILACAVLLINCIEHSNILLLLIFFILYAQAIFGQVIFLSAFFESSKYAGLLGTLMYFGFQLLNLPV